MYIINKTKDTIVADPVFVANTFWLRLKGLLGTRVLPERHGLLITPCNSVHTFGMNYPIDVLFVDKNNQIIKVVENMSSGKMRMALGSQYVIEVPAGTASQAGCRVGDRLERISSVS